MAIRGVKPKPFLKMITGGPGKAPGETELPPAAVYDPGHDNGLEPPKKLGKRQQQLWDEYIRKAPWLKSFDVPRAYMWVELNVEFEKKPGDMVAGKIAQLRALGSELGLDPASRSRIAGEVAKLGNKDPADEFFA